MTSNYSQVQIHIARTRLSSKDRAIQQGQGYPARTGLSSKDRAIQQGPGYPARTGLASNSKDAGLASKDWAS